jgi:hypothetical protein
MEKKTLVKKWDQWEQRAFDTWMNADFARYLQSQTEQDYLKNRTTERKSK